MFANAWAAKSEELVYSHGYLDRLGKIYLVEDAEDREVSPSLLESIREAYEENDDAELLRKLFRLKKFPINNPYVRLLQKLPDAMQQNPETVGMVARQVRRLTWHQLEGAIQAPIEANRQLGSRFTGWLRGHEYCFVEEDEFLRSSEGIVFLSGSDQVITDFAQGHLDYAPYRDSDTPKRLDFLAKAGNIYVLGEAKFFGDTGGNQNNQLKDAMSLVESQDSLVHDARAVAILDGAVWVRGKSFMYRTVSSTEHDVMSALLLPEYLETLL